MPACSSCRAEVGPDALRCRRCGADLAKSVGPAGLEPLELALDEAPAAAPKRPPPPKNPPAARPAVAAGPTVKAAPAPPSPAPALSQGPSIDLDLSAAGSAGLPPRLAASAGQAATGLRIGPDGQLIAPPTSGPRKSGVGLDEDGLDPFDIRAHADFGESPAAFYLAPLYAYRVIVRRKELRAELAACLEDVKRAAERIEDAVVAFGERVRPVAAENPIYRRALAPIEEVESLVASRDSALASDLATYRAATGKIDEKLRELEAKLFSINEQSAAISAELERLEDTAKRETAKARRADIDIRTAEETASRGVADAERGALELHVKEKRAARETHASEAARLAPLIEAQRQKLDAPKSAALAVEREMAAARAERAQAEETSKRKSGARTAGSQDARDRLRGVYSDFGRTALADARTFGGEYGPSRKAIEDLLRQKGDRERRVRLVEKAIASADEPIVKRGFVVAALGLVVTLLVVVGLPAYRIFVPVKPPPLYPVDE